MILRYRPHSLQWLDQVHCPPPRDIDVPTTFAEELSVWGPAHGPSPAISPVEAEAYCRRLATTHYENFPVVSWLLPRKLHQHFYNVYAYCRWADDLADETGDSASALALLGWWRDQLRLCYQGEATHPVFVSLAVTIREFGIPEQPFEDLISAFEQDQRVKEYETFEQLRDYCRGSANPVGRLVLYLCRQAKEEHFVWSDSICTGLQLANFWQDVSRDLDIGRVYLPREDCQRFGYAWDDLQHRITNAAFLDLMQFETDRARDFLKPWKPEDPSPLREFPFRLRVDIDLFARGGLKILDRIEAIGYRVWDQRPVVTKWDVARLFMGSFLRTLS